MARLFLWRVIPARRRATPAVQGRPIRTGASRRRPGPLRPTPCLQSEPDARPSGQAVHDAKPAAARAGRPGAAPAYGPLRTRRRPPVADARSGPSAAMVRRPGAGRRPRTARRTSCSAGIQGRGGGSQREGRSPRRSGRQAAPGARRTSGAGRKRRPRRTGCGQKNTAAGGKPAADIIPDGRAGEPARRQPISRGPRPLERLRSAGCRGTGSGRPGS